MYNQDHFKLFITHCCRDEILLAEAAAQVDAMDLIRSGCDNKLAAVWHVVREFYNAYKKIPDVAAIIAQFKQYLVAYVSDPESLQQHKLVCAQYLAFSHNVGTASTELAYEMLTAMVRTLHVEPKIEQVVAEGMANRDFSGLATRMHELSVRHAGMSKPVSISGISRFVHEGGARLPTYISWFDSRVAAPGPVRGGSMGIVAPTGVGKTTFGIQLGVEQSLSGNHASLVLVEEWSRTVQRRILACATSIPTDILERNGDDVERALHELHLDPEITLKKIETVDKYLHVMDLTLEGDCRSVRNELSIFKRSNTLPNYLYLDWAGELADRLVASMPEYRDNKRGAISHICDETAKWAKEFNIFCAVSQQMDAETAQKGPFVKSNEYCAMDCKAFAMRLKYCIVINPLDEVTGLNILRFSKARDDAKPRPFPVRLRGNISRFEDASDKYSINNSGRIVSAGMQDTNGPVAVMPGSRADDDGEDLFA